MAEIVQIDAETWSLEDGFVRFFLLAGEEKAVMIDSGASCPDALSLAKTLTDKPVMLLNTHGDGDHTSGTAAFNEIHMHASDYINCGVGSRFPSVALAEVNDGDTLDLGGRPLKLIHIPGHTRGSIAVLDIKNRTLYAGDSVQKGHIYMFGSHRCPGHYEASLDKLIAMKDEYDIIYASHDELTVPNDYAEKVKSVWQQVQRGELSYKEIELHGRKVRSYTADACGFYTEL